MEFTLKIGLPEKQRTACLVNWIYEGRHLPPSVQKLAEQSQSPLKQLLKQGDLDGRFGQTLISSAPLGALERILLIGCGPSKTPLSDAQYQELLQRALIAIQNTGATDALFCLNDIHVHQRDLKAKIRQAVQILNHFLYRFEECKSKKTPPRLALRRITFLVPGKREHATAEQALTQGLAIARAIDTAKNLAHLPPNICTPAYLADHAKKMAKNTPKLSAAILDKKEIAALKMGLLLSVAQGSDLPPKLITLEYRGHKNANTKPIVFIGKGITFDTGGNSLKPPAAMIGMKYDMCGAATVIAVLQAAAELALPLNIIGVIPTCENMPGPAATRPEDVITSMLGLTVEILNTDAEGRLILADALTYTERFHPDTVIDIATLTGGCVVALGPYASGLMGNDQPLVDDLLAAGLNSGDRAWPLPLWNEYFDALKSETADISNVPIADIGAKTIIAGCFLAKFAEKFKWAHLDVANTACQFQGAKRGPTGRPVPLLMHYLFARANML